MFVLSFQPYMDTDGDYVKRDAAGATVADVLGMGRAVLSLPVVRPPYLDVTDSDSD